MLWQPFRLVRVMQAKPAFYYYLFRATFLISRRDYARIRCSAAVYALRFGIKFEIYRQREAGYS